MKKMTMAFVFGLALIGSACAMDKQDNQQDQHDKVGSGFFMTGPMKDIVKAAIDSEGQGQSKQENNVEKRSIGTRLLERCKIVLNKTRHFASLPPVQYLLGDFHTFICAYGGACFVIDVLGASKYCGALVGTAYIVHQSFLKNKSNNIVARSV